MALKFKSIDAAIRYLEEADCKVASVKVRDGETLAQASNRLSRKAEAAGYSAPLPSTLYVAG